MEIRRIHMRTIVESMKITIVFKSQLPFEESDLDKELQGRGFSVPSDGRYLLRVSPDGRESRATRWTKEETDAYYDPTRSFLGVEGKNPDNVSKVFKELRQASMAILKDAMGNEFKYAELLAIVRSGGEGTSLASFRSHKDELVVKIGKLLDEEVQRFSVTACSVIDDKMQGPLTEVLNWTHISAEPLIVNPRFCIARIVYRRVNADLVESFGENLEIFASRLMGEIESGR